MNDHLEELVRRASVIDMMLSMHSRLRDRYNRRALWFDLAAMWISVILCATVFLDPQLAARTPLGYFGATVVVGSASVVLFFLSIVALRVDWKEAAGRHARAVAALVELKAKSNSVSRDAVHQLQSLQEFFRLYDFTVATLVPIPDSQFASLKAYHYRKIELSREISRYPSAPLFILRAKLAARDTAESLKRSRNSAIDGPSK